MPIPGASHSSSKGLEKSARDRIGALVSKNFILWEAFSSFSP